tara:strand:- start:485 stop:1000 length:516 start_codon:yes stop_codon:yes gene_type:complete
MEWPHTTFSLWVDRCLNKIGEWASWLWLLLLLVIVVNVLMRYVFGEGRIEFEEVQWHLYAVGFLLGLSYANVHDAHIRVDLIRDRLSPRHRAWIELYGILLLLLPFVGLVIVYSVPFIQYSFATSEVSEAPGGLPYRWLIKSCLLLGFALLMLSTLARLTRVWRFLFGASS